MASVFRRLSQPTDALVRVPHLPIVGEERLAKGVLCLRQTMLCRPGEPVLCLAAVRDQQRAVPIELPHEVLGVGVAALCQPLQFLHCSVPVAQGESVITDNMSQFPAGIGFASYLLRFVVAGQVSVLEGDLPQPDALRLPDDSVFDLPEFFLLGQLFLLSGFVVVVAVDCILEDTPLFVAGFHRWYFLQIVHYLIHGFLHGLGEVSVGLFALDRFQLSGQLLHLLLDGRLCADAPGHLLCEFSNGPAGFPHQFVPRL